MMTTKALFSADGLDERSLEFLAKTIENNNLPGFDYFEFKRSSTNRRPIKAPSRRPRPSA